MGSLVGRTYQVALCLEKEILEKVVNEGGGFGSGWFALDLVSVVEM